MTYDIEAALDRAQDSGLRGDTAEAAFAPFLGFSTRDGYLEWRGAWRARINALTASCRQARAAHVKAGALGRQAEACTDPAERTALREAEAAAWKERWGLGSRDARRERATSLLALRAASKREAARQWQASRLPAAA